MTRRSTRSVEVTVEKEKAIFRQAARADSLRSAEALPEHEPHAEEIGRET
jgi:hypothetical protein